MIHIQYEYYNRRMGLMCCYEHGLFTFLAEVLHNNNDINVGTYFMKQYYLTLCTVIYEHYL